MGSLDSLFGKKTPSTPAENPGRPPRAAEGLRPSPQAGSAKPGSTALASSTSPGLRIHPPGSLISGRYEVAGRPLMGGMGIVYPCLDRREDRPVALKTCKPEYLPDREARDRFLREGTTWMELGKHPHIVHAHGAERIGDGREVYLVLELVAKGEGRRDASLRSWLMPGRPLPIDQALLFALQVARAMRHAVGVIPGFVHRDLKPENLLVGADYLSSVNINRLRVTDFGLASVFNKSGQQSIISGQEPVDNCRTQLTHGVLGTPLYMAPEQWKGEGVCIQTDMYALGCILYEMVTGRFAVRGNTMAALREGHCVGQEREWPQGLPGLLVEVGRRCLDLMPQGRYSDWGKVEGAVCEAYRSATGRTAPEPERGDVVSRAERVALGHAQCNLGFSYLDIGKAEVALGYFDRACAVGEAEGEPGVEAAGLGNLGLAYAALGKTQRAIGCHEQALAIFRKIGNRRGEAMLLGNLGLAYVALGEAQQGIRYYEQALAINREIGDRRGECTVLTNLGGGYCGLGEARRAIDYCEQALVIAREIGDRGGEGKALGNLGNAYYLLGEAQQAIGYYKQDLAIAREIGDRRGEGTALGNLGLAYEALGEVRQALDCYEKDLVIQREIGHRSREAAALSRLGNTYVALGEVPRAITYYEQALAVAHEIGDRSGASMGLYNLGYAYKILGETQQSIGYYEQALAMSLKVGDRHGEGIALGNLGAAYEALGEARQALGYYQRALAIHQEIGDIKGVALCWLSMAMLYDQQGDPGRALLLARKAARSFEQIGHTEYARGAQELVAEIQAKLRH